MKQKTNSEKAVILFTFITICVAIMSGLSSQIFTNYFKEVYNVTSIQRGFLEIPRETPGVICMFIITGLASLGDIKIALISQLLVAVGLTVMGTMSPSYGGMMIFLFIASLGQHIFMPLNDAIGMSLSENGKVGQTLGKFKSYSTLFSLITSLLVFVGFKNGFFSFKSKIIVPFVISVAAAIAAAILLGFMNQHVPKSSEKVKQKLILRKEYLPYYLVTLAYGCQKRIKLVFGPWVIADLMLQGADTLSLLAIGTHFIGIALANVIGRMLDKLGITVSLIVEGIYIILSFSAMGYMAGGFASGKFTSGGHAMYIAFAVYIVCNLFDQFNSVHAYLMRSIAKDPSEITSTLSVGLSVDHVLAVVVSSVFGIIWSKAGAQYVFYICSITAAIQIAVGLHLRSQ